MKFNNDVFNQLKEIIGSTSGVYSAVRRYEQKFKAYSAEAIFYFIAAKKNIKISKYNLEENLMSKVNELLERDKNPERNSEKKVKNITKKFGKECPYDFPLSQFNIDGELVKDCKLVKPYRGCIKEALLTLETKIKKKLNTDKNGQDLIKECLSREVFNKKEKSEKDGLYFLFSGAIGVFRNPPSHNKIYYSKEDAIKVILFTDYLIKLFFDLCNQNNIK